MKATRWKSLSPSLARPSFPPISTLTPEPREDHAAYIGHWLDVLKNDKRAIFTAASYAQRAADFLSNLNPAAQQEAA